MNKKKGISLIVLIITIVVIIILAAAIILNLSNTNIIGNANEAVVKQDFKAFQDELNMYVADKYAETRGTFDASTLNADAATAPNILKSLKNSKYEGKVTIVNGKIVVSGLDEQVQEWANEALGSGTASNPDEPQEPDATEYPKTAVNTEVTGNNATITGKNPTTTNPVIPVGFKAIETTDATWADSDNDGNPDGWNDGLVIQDANSNEFVWVPVDGINIQYAKRFDEYPKYSEIISVSDDTDVLPTDTNGNAILETSQIINYGGFYVGRFEAGVPANQTEIDGTFGERETSKSDVNGTPVVQRGATVWTRISYNKAIENAKRVCVDNQSVRSGLITGTQWDTMCAWIDSEKDSEGNSIHSVTNSITWGNYKDDPVDGDNGKQAAGSKEEWKAKNIYDIAGNAYEWNGEKKVEQNYSDSRVQRGGCYNSNGMNSTAAYRVDNIFSNSFDDLSFRIVLYVM